MGKDLDHERSLSLFARFAQRPKVIETEDLQQSGLVVINPRYGRQTAGSLVNTLREMLFVNDGDKSGEETLQEVQDVGDRWT